MEEVEKPLSKGLEAAADWFQGIAWALREFAAAVEDEAWKRREARLSKP